jgi:bifunctional DNase/RNase
VLVLQQVADPVTSEDARALEVHVSGDSALGIYAQLNGQATERPMALDVLWQLWQKARGDWALLRVAVVALKGDIFVARAFFGDAETGRAVWDIDCRPSDAMFLAMKVGCCFSWAVVGRCVGGGI